MRLTSLANTPVIGTSAMKTVGDTLGHRPSRHHPWCGAGCWTGWQLRRVYATAQCGARKSGRLVSSVRASWPDANNFLPLTRTQESRTAVGGWP